MSFSNDLAPVLRLKEAFEEKISNLETKIDTKNLKNNEVSKSELRPVEKPKKDFFQVLTDPSHILMTACISLLSGYLIYQNYLFFTALEKNQVSAMTNSFVADFIPMIAAACLSFAVSKMQRLFCSVILCGSIVGLGMFMHASVKTSLVSQSETSQSLTKERSVLEKNIDEQLLTLKSTPESHLTKRQALSEQIEKDRRSLSALNTEKKISNFSDVDGTSVGYGAWLRIAAMLMNAYLIHYVFGRLKSAK